MPDLALDRPLTIFVAATLAVAASYAGSFLAMHSDALLDNPNHRSSHDHAVSRAGGLAMLAAAVAGLFVIAVFAGGDGARGPALKFLVLGVLAGGVGFADDRFNLSAPVKFGGQLLVAIAFVWQVGPLEAASLPFVGVAELGFFGAAITVFWIVGFMNVFNFMDGVNGIAGVAAVIGLLLFGLVAGSSGAGAAAGIAVVTAAAAAGFLPANLLRGRLFMGDCGSHFLAFMIAGLAIFAANASGGLANPFLLPTMFLPFIVDVAFTLTHRIARGQNVFVAHREHIYQLVLRRGASHGTVAVLYAGAIAFSAAGAILMLMMPPAWMWTAPAAIAIVLLSIAIAVYSNAKAAGMIDAVSGDSR